MIRAELDTLLDEVKAFVSEPNFKQETTRYLAYRKRLVEIANDPANANDIRLDAYTAGEIGLKSAFHAVVGACSNIDTKSLKLYGHECMTSKCRVRK